MKFSEQVKKLLDSAWNEARGNNYQKAISILSDSPYSGHPIVLGALSYYYYMTSQYELATEHAGRALEINPNNRRALTVLGDIALKKGNFDKAAMYFSDAHKRFPDNIYISKRLSYILSQQNRFDEMARVLERTREFHPWDIELMKELKYAYALKGDHEKVQELDDLISTNPERKNDPAHVAEKYIRQLHHLPPEEAVKTLKQIIELPSFKNEIRLYDAFVSYLFKLGRFEEAIEPLEQLYALQPRSESVKYKLAYCLVRSGKPHRALELLQSLRIKNANVTAVKAEALWKIGRAQEALSLAMKALYQYPENKRLRRLVVEMRNSGVRPVNSNEKKKE